MTTAFTPASPIVGTPIKPAGRALADRLAAAETEPQVDGVDWGAAKAVIRRTTGVTASALRAGVLTRQVMAPHVDGLLHIAEALAEQTARLVRVVDPTGYYEQDTDDLLVDFRKMRAWWRSCADAGHTAVDDETARAAADEAERFECLDDVADEAEMFERLDDGAALERLRASIEKVRRGRLKWP